MRRRSGNPTRTPEPEDRWWLKRKRRKHKWGLKRDPQVEQLNEEHFRFLWAAYRRDCFTGNIVAGLDRDGFIDAFSEAIGDLLRTGGEGYVMVAQTPLGRIPVGFLVIEFRGSPDMKRQAWPEPLWFPEASPRNKLELMLRVMLDLKKEHLVLVLAKPASWTFLRHLCDFGVMRAVGKIRAYWADGADAMQYQST